MSNPLFAEKLKSVQSEMNLHSQLLIVSKTRSVEEIEAYYNLGHRDFGENRVQELIEKSEALRVSCPEIRWHMIGNLQSNKIHQLFSVHNLWAIHSVDDRDLVEKLIKAENRLNHTVNVFLQYNTSREQEKAGFEDYESLKSAATLFHADHKLKCYGLMTMGTLRTEEFEVEARRCFKELTYLKEKLGFDLGLELQTSMGMSQDYKIAIEEKSNWIRLGTMMFRT